MPVNQQQQRLSENLSRVRSEIAAAAARAGRRPEQIRLVAVTKSADVARILSLIELGQRDLAENRVQALAERAQAVIDAGRADAVSWHMIGTLQRNKVRTVLPLVRLIHSVDSLRLAEELSRRALAMAEMGSNGHGSPNGSPEPVRVLLEVNVSGEASKEGLSPAELPAVLEATVALPRLEVRGLMTMAPFEAAPEATRPVFAELRSLSAELRRRLPTELAERFTELSMGMSNDYRVAVEEGSTMVRVGTALFEGT